MGRLTSTTANGSATSYTQDLASGKSQVLARTTSGVTTDFLYGQDRLAASTSGARAWYLPDGQGSALTTILSCTGQLLSTSVNS